MKNRVGEMSVNTYGTPMKIIEYNNYKSVIIEFQDDYKYTTKISYKDFKSGYVKNPYDRVIRGVGYIGEKYFKNRKKHYSYEVWRGIIQRCYDTKYKNKYTTYNKCELCKEWECFENFKEWYDKNYYKIEGQRMCIDKDILFKGNKIYSPKTCCIIPQEINKLFTKTDKLRGKYPIGVVYDKDANKFIAECNIGHKKQMKIGRYNTVEEAFMAYKICKENYIKQVADKYKGIIPNNVYNAMYNYRVEITD